MQKVPDWLQLWSDLVEKQNAVFEARKVGKDAWKKKAKGFDKDVKKRWSRPDSSRDFVLSKLDSESTVLDIGAGTGSWAILMAKTAKLVTALEPSEAMTDVLLENAKGEGVENVEVINGTWPDAQVGEYDYTLCSHAMYAVPDLTLFVERMEQVTRKICFLLMRIPTPNGIMAQAANHIWGQPYDSPNFQVAFNAMLQMGKAPNVLMENTGLWKPWKNESIEEALGEVKRRMAVTDTNEYDTFLTRLLEENLTKEDGQVVWPRGVRSGLLYWEPEK